MYLQAWDTVFVRARRRDVHAVIRGVARWGEWWPGTTSRSAGDAVAVTLRAPGRLRPRHGRPQRYLVEVSKDRPGLGVNLRYRGDLDGEAEFYYLDERAGITVHYLLRAHTSVGRWPALLRDHRAAVRAGLNALKDRFEGGRLPGQEPDEALLCDQREAIAEFRAAVKASQRRAAAEPRADQREHR